MSGNGRIIAPNQMNVTTTYADGPLAQPSSLPLQTAGGVQVLVLGGLTKVEQLAGQIAAGVIKHHDRALHEGPFEEVEDRLVNTSLRFAEKLLAESARRRTAESTKVD